MAQAGAFSDVVSLDLFPRPQDTPTFMLGDKITVQDIQGARNDPRSDSLGLHPRQQLVALVGQTGSTRLGGGFLVGGGTQKSSVEFCLGGNRARNEVMTKWILITEPGNLCKEVNLVYRLRADRARGVIRSMRALTSAPLLQYSRGSSLRVIR